jgi:hydroxymethylglutaryl-CoA lyase
VPAAGTSVSICDAWARDGIQGWPMVIDTSAKIRVINELVLAGVQELDVTSFVPTTVVPQFFDADQVLGGVDPGVAVRVLTPNVRGAARVVQAHKNIRTINRCGFPFSASEAHNIANLRRDHAAHKEQVRAIVDLLAAEGIDPLIGIATAWGCPIQGQVRPEMVLDLAGWAYDLGVRSMMFGDTTGMASPRAVFDLFSAAADHWPDVELIGHFHDNRGAGIANALAAICAGVGTIDASLGGIGGEPSAVDQGDVGEAGNVVTEDLASLLEQLEVVTRIDLAALLRAGATAEAVLGHRLHSRVQRSGPVSHNQEES